MRPRDVIILLEADGWYAVRQNGSHRHFRHPFKKGLVTVCIHPVDIKIGTLMKIQKDSGVRLR